MCLLFLYLFLFNGTGTEWLHFSVFLNFCSNGFLVVVKRENFLSSGCWWRILWLGIWSWHEGRGNWSSQSLQYLCGHSYEGPALRLPYDWYVNFVSLKAALLLLWHSTDNLGWLPIIMFHISVFCLVLLGSFK